MQSAGKNVQDALSNLVSNAMRQGGTSSQSADARALSAASGLGGDIVGNLQSMGQGSMFDDKIRQLQGMGEKSGYSSDISKAINVLRSKQSGMAQDARSMQSINFKPSGGGLQGSGGMDVAGGGDELSLIAQLLGKYQGNLRYNQGPKQVGADSNLRDSINTEDSAMINSLKPIYDELLGQKKLETQAMQRKLMESANPPRMMQQGDNVNRYEEERRSLAHLAQQRRDERRRSVNQPKQSSFQDPRAEAIRAALQYMMVNKPHRIGSI